MVRLDKNVLLTGAKPKKCELKTRKGEVYLKPLTVSEVAEYNQITSKALGTFNTKELGKRGRGKGETSTTGNINLSKTQKAQFEAKCYAVATSLTCADMEFTQDEVKDMDGDLFNEIFEKVSEISGLEVEDLDEIIEEFQDE